MRGCGLAVVLVAVALVGVGLVRGTQDTPAAGTGEPAAGDLAPFVPGPGPVPGGDGGAGPDGAGPAGEDWASVVRGLDAARLAALRDLDEVGLRRVYVPAARALREDLAAVRTLRDAGLAPRGVEVEVESVELVGRPGFDRAVLRVSDRRGRYRLVEAGGRAVVSTVAAGEARTWRMVLQRDGADWRIARVRPTS